MMKVYVVTGEPYHDNSSLEGVYSSPERAKSSKPHVRWRVADFYAGNGWNAMFEGYYAMRGTDEDEPDCAYLIREVTVQ